MLVSALSLSLAYLPARLHEVISVKGGFAQGEKMELGILQVVES
jgi:hypothetical protein